MSSSAHFSMHALSYSPHFLAPLFVALWCCLSPHVSSSASQCSARMLGRKQYSPPRAHKPGYALQAPAYGSLGMVKVPVPSFAPAIEVLLVGEAHEVAVVMPLRFDELELAGE